MVSAAGLILSTEMYHQLLSHVRTTRPREAVGLLGGNSTGHVMVVLPLANVAAGNRAFIADPYAQFCALRRLQSENVDLVAIYHSHPDGGVEPSEEDLVYARRWSCIHLIVAVGLDAQSGERLRAFRCDQRGSIERVDIRLPSS